ncbi:MAG: hypothetical protein WCR66_06495 [Bacteroidota bacterium]
MKKLLVLLLLMVYGSATMGTTVHLHYCMNKVVGWSLADNQDHKCHSCGMEKKAGCCKDSKAQIKLAADQQKADPAKNVNFNAQLVCSQPIASDYFLAVVATTEIVSQKSDSPPILPILEEPEFLCVFRI